MDQPNSTFTDADLSNGVTYYYRISAVDETGNESAYSDEASATPISAVIPAQTWTQLNPTGGLPAKRSGHSAVYNASTNRMIVFGGCVGANIVSAPSVLNDVWVLENADGMGGTPAWHQLTPTGPSPSARAYHPAVYDPTTNRMIVFGGNPRVGYCRGTTNDIWVLEHADGLGGTPAWHSLSPTSATGTPPGVRNLHCAVYDPDTNRLMVFGGQDACESDKNDVWVLEHANGLGGIPNWILLNPVGGAPVGRSAHSAVYDPGSNRMIIYGGAYPYKGDVWALENANGLGGTPNWIELLPDGTDPIRIGHTAVYQASTNRMIVFGGGDTSARKNDVWVLNNANGVSGTPTWTELDPTGTSLDNRVDHTAVYNPATKRMIILGGSNCTAGCYDLDDVWVLAPDLVVAVPEISLSADSYDFGEVHLGASSDWTLTVSN
ncbi:MAG: hypothetical protein KAI38_06960, partial [Candidatus Latescibacteria bacterium]|nr:hypothetical protein [Candidatus Latescibacterota bacterium]